MHRTDAENNVDGAFTDDFEGTLVGTVVDAGWLNSVQEEIISILTLAGIEPNEASNVQMAAAMTILLSSKAPLASPALTGVPTAPTAAPGTNSTQIATTGFAADLGATHAAETAPHGATSALTALRLIWRDAFGRAKVAAPVAADDIARLATVTDHAAIAGTEAISGHMKVAAAADMLIDNDAKAVTPKKLRLGFSALIAAVGYIAFPTWLGGLIFQWGSHATDGNSVVAFPLEFPSALFVAIPIAQGTTYKFATATAPLPASFTVRLWDYLSGNIIAGNVFWFAVGH